MAAPRTVDVVAERERCAAELQRIALRIGTLRPPWNEPIGRASARLREASNLRSLLQERSAARKRLRELRRISEMRARTDSKRARREREVFAAARKVS